jgi:acetyl-CoA C-acetyltransferase
MENVVIVSGIRTPIGAYGGAFRDVPVYRLGSTVFNEAVKRAGFDPLRVDDVIMGQSYQNGECANGGRMALLEADWPDTARGHPGSEMRSGCWKQVWQAEKILMALQDMVG